MRNPFTVEGVRALVRPTVTWGLIAVQAGIGIGWATGGLPQAEAAFAAMSPFSMMTLTWYFKDREPQAN